MSCFRNFEFQFMLFKMEIIFKSSAFLHVLLADLSISCSSRMKSSSMKMIYVACDSCFVCTKAYSSGAQVSSG